MKVLTFAILATSASGALASSQSADPSNLIVQLMFGLMLVGLFALRRR